MNSLRTYKLNFISTQHRQNRAFTVKIPLFKCTAWVTQAVIT